MAVWNSLWRRPGAIVRDAFYSFGTSISWSSLSSIGNSALARLTIIMPFVGYLLVFNSTISDFLSTVLPKEGDVEVNSIWVSLYSQNLYFLYFGLLFFGSGVALFNVAAPSQIRRFPAVESYIGAMESIKTPNLIIGSFENVIAMYFRGLQGEERSPMVISRRVGFPSMVSGDLHRFIERIFLRTEFAGEVGPYDEDGFVSTFQTGSGYLMTDEILETAYSGRRMDRILHQALLDQAVEQPTDVFYLEHRALDFCRSEMRFLVFVFFAFGSALLILPSLFTSAVIFEAW